MIDLEMVPVVSLGMDGAVASVLEPVSCALNLVDKVWTFILWLELGGHIGFNHSLPN